MKDTKISNQRVFIKDLRANKPKSQIQEARLAIFQLQVFEIYKAKKEKKKNSYNSNCDQDQRPQESLILVTKVNILKFGKKKKKKKKKK